MARFTWWGPLLPPPWRARPGHSLLALLAALGAGGGGGAFWWKRWSFAAYMPPTIWTKVLATFALILIFSEGTRLIFRVVPAILGHPKLAVWHPVRCPAGIQYPLYRLALIGAGLAVAMVLWLLIERTRIGIQDSRSGPKMTGEMIARPWCRYIKALHVLILRAGGPALAGLAGATL